MEFGVVKIVFHSMILEYVRIMSTDRDAMSYIYRGQDISINVQDA